MPDEPEPLGLLALMQLHLARAEARFGPEGSLILLPDQDRSRWDHAAIEAAVGLVERAARMAHPGPYQLQAAIVAVHAGSASYAATDWRRIVALYDQLFDLQPTAVVALNRAVALAAIEPLGARLDGYHLFHATRAELLRRLGRTTEARAANQRALSLTENPAERRLLEERLAAFELHD